MAFYSHPSSVYSACGWPSDAATKVSNESRVEGLLKRYTGLIEKAEKTLTETKKVLIAKEDRVTLRRKWDPEKSVKIAVADRSKRRRIENENGKRNLRRRMEVQKKREEARREIADMKNTAGIYDPAELRMDIEKMLGYSITGPPPRGTDNLSVLFGFRLSCRLEQKVEELEEGEIRDG